MTKQEIRTAAMSLEPKDREELAEELLHSIDEILDPEWAEEIEKRLKEIDDGEPLLDGEEAIRDIREQIRR
jgi:Putative addiction module component